MGTHQHQPELECVSTIIIIAMCVMIVIAYRMEWKKKKYKLIL